ncbi:MBOAT family protein [Helicobacter sp. CLO-3]|uniref:MBOAT family O-acyltransferase n=2 Tax=unclassified Helicobacter TaxID=2593540 RepID=UPI0026C22559|nr:MBOAT family O-acyltransferase [Helicobacter sp. CLO-3]
MQGDKGSDFAIQAPLSPCKESNSSDIDSAKNVCDTTNKKLELPESTHSKPLLSPKFFLILGIVFNLALLGFFKYTDFLLENFNLFSQLLHLDFTMPLPHIVLPLAISFFTFQQIAYLVDCYKSPKQYATHLSASEFLDYCLFVTFFPQLIAGPIVHHREMMPQFRKLNSAGDENSAKENSSLGKICGSERVEASSLPPKVAPRHTAPQPTNFIQDTRILECGIDNLPKNHKNLHSHTANLGICESVAKVDSGNLAESKKNLDSGRHCEEAKLTKQSTSNIESAQINCFANARKTNEASFFSNDTAQPTNTTFYESIAKGLFIFSIGLFKKVVIADSFAVWANAGFGAVENGAVLNLFESWATSLSYTFQLYFDFSGYCDMAIGLGLLFGITLPLNFNSPYKARNIADFWRRWHMTLGRFLKEYVYIPLGGNRNEKYKSALHYVMINKILTLRNLFIVAFLSGVWHGAGWGFVVWGCLHGVAMVVHRIYKNSACTQPLWELEISPLRRTQSAPHSEISTQPTNLAHNLGILEGVAESRKNLDSNANTESTSRHCEDLQNPKQSTSNIESAQMDCFAHARKTNEASFFSNDNTASFLDNDKNKNLDSRKPESASILDSNHHKQKPPFKQKLLTLLYWFLTFNFVNLSWIFFRAENISGALNLIKGMFSGVIVLPNFLESKLGFLEKYGVGFDWWDNSILEANSFVLAGTLLGALLLVVVCKNSFEISSKLDNKKMFFAGALFMLCTAQLGISSYVPEFLYFNF